MTELNMSWHKFDNSTNLIAYVGDETVVGRASVQMGSGSHMTTTIATGIDGKVISGSGTQNSRGDISVEKEYAEKLVRENYERLTQKW